MWELVATAAAGLNAGAGLQAALAGGPTADDASFAKFAGRSRLINLMLTTSCTAAAAATYYAEQRGALWLYASVATAIGIPFNLLLMAPPTPVVHHQAKLEPSGLAMPHLDAPVAEGPHGGLDQNGGESDPALAGSSPTPGVTFAEDTSSSTGYNAQRFSSRSPQKLMYAKSGVLVSPDAYASSWTRKFWFSACLSCLSCGAMLALLATRKDAATYTNTPF